MVRTWGRTCSTRARWPPRWRASWPASPASPCRTRAVTSTMRLSSDRRPSLCVSSTSTSPPAYDTAMLLNINLPALPGDQVKGVKVTHLGSRVFSEEIALMKDPWGKEIYWIGGGRITWSGDADSDFRATSDGYISVTPLHMDMTNYDLIEVVRKWLPGD